MFIPKRMSTDKPNHKHRKSIVKAQIKHSKGLPVRSYAQAGLPAGSYAQGGLAQLKYLQILKMKTAYT